MAMCVLPVVMAMCVLPVAMAMCVLPVAMAMCVLPVLIPALARTEVWSRGLGSLSQVPCDAGDEVLSPVRNPCVIACGPGRQQ